MKLTDYLKEDRILMNLRASGKKEALEILCGRMARLDGLPLPEILKVVLEREELGSTGLEGGVALPHGKIALVSRPTLVLALSSVGVAFDSLDGRPARVFVLMLSPRDGNGREHMRLLARLGWLFKSPAAVEEILSSTTTAEAYDFLARREISP